MDLPLTEPISLDSGPADPILGDTAPADTEGPIIMADTGMEDIPIEATTGDIHTGRMFITVAGYGWIRDGDSGGVCLPGLIIIPIIRRHLSSSSNHQPHTSKGIRKQRSRITGIIAGPPKVTILTFNDARTAG